MGVIKHPFARGWGFDKLVRGAVGSGQWADVRVDQKFPRFADH